MATSFNILNINKSTTGLAIVNTLQVNNATVNDITATNALITTAEVDTLKVDGAVYGPVTGGGLLATGPPGTWTSIAVGANNPNVVLVGDSTQNKAFVYDYIPSTKTYTLKYTINGNTGSQFGSYVDITNDGTVFFVGAPEDTVTTAQYYPIIPSLVDNPGILVLPSDQGELNQIGNLWVINEGTFITYGLTGITVGQTITVDTKDVYLTTIVPHLMQLNPPPTAPGSYSLYNAAFYIFFGFEEGIINKGISRWGEYFEVKDTARNLTMKYKVDGDDYVQNFSSYITAGQTIGFPFTNIPTSSGVNYFPYANEVGHSGPGIVGTYIDGDSTAKNIIVCDGTNQTARLLVVDSTPDSGVTLDSHYFQFVFKPAVDLDPTGVEGFGVCCQMAGYNKDIYAVAGDYVVKTWYNGIENIINPFCKVPITQMRLSMDGSVIAILADNVYIYTREGDHVWTLYDTIVGTYNEISFGYTTKDTTMTLYALSASTTKQFKFVNMLREVDVADSLIVGSRSKVTTYESLGTPLSIDQCAKTSFLMNAMSNDGKRFVFVPFYDTIYPPPAGETTYYFLYICDFNSTTGNFEITSTYNTNVDRNEYLASYLGPSNGPLVVLSGNGKVVLFLAAQLEDADKQGTKTLQKLSIFHINDNGTVNAGKSGVVTVNEIKNISPFSGWGLVDNSFMKSGEASATNIMSVSYDGNKISGILADIPGDGFTIPGGLSDQKAIIFFETAGQDWSSPVDHLLHGSNQYITATQVITDTGIVGGETGLFNFPSVTALSPDGQSVMVSGTFSKKYVDQTGVYEYTYRWGTYEGNLYVYNINTLTSECTYNATINSYQQMEGENVNDYLGVEIANYITDGGKTIMSGGEAIGLSGVIVVSKYDDFTGTYKRNDLKIPDQLNSHLGLSAILSSDGNTVYAIGAYSADEITPNNTANIYIWRYNGVKYMYEGNIQMNTPALRWSICRDGGVLITAPGVYEAGPTTGGSRYVDTINAYTIQNPVFADTQLNHDLEVYNLTTTDSLVANTCQIVDASFKGVTIANIDEVDTSDPRYVQLFYDKTTGKLVITA